MKRELLPRRSAFLLLLLLANASCEREISRVDVQGSWVSNTPPAERLRLETDGHYMHEYVGRDGRAHRQTGAWDLKGDGLELKAFVIDRPHDLFGGDVLLPLNVTFYSGEIRIPIDEDFGRYFVRDDDQR